ncbi:MAG: alpha/beta hydrolase [Candidatus Gracilibacteria bacterium]
MSKKTAFIIHGVEGYPEENWFPWLKAELEKEGYQVFVPQFPTPEGQTLENWLKAFEPYEKYCGEETIAIGHSLGSPFVVNLLEKLKFKAFFSVAGYIDSTGNVFEKTMSTFTARNFDWEKIRENCKNFYVFHSDNDEYNGLDKAQQLAEKLNTQVIVVSGAGHFNTKAGYTKFPLLLEKIKTLI